MHAAEPLHGHDGALDRLEQREREQRASGTQSAICSHSAGAYSVSTSSASGTIVCPTRTMTR
jgi:hypothetical protein